MGLRPPLLLPTSLTQLLGACCIYIYISTPAIQQIQINTAVGVGEGPDFGSDCCEKHFSAKRSWQQNKRKHMCVDPKLN
jgi:hypothetical protein